MLDGAASVFLVVFAAIDSYIVVFQIDQRGFIVACEEMVFFLIV